jgi:hypothetical protein
MDGISDAGELSTLDQLGISSISVAKTDTNQLLANGNSIRGTGNFTRTDSSTQQLANVYFAVDTFTSKYTDHITVLPEVANLPDMQGAGLVHDLHEASNRLLKYAHMLCCAVPIGATYAKNTSHFSGFARFASERI